MTVNFKLSSSVGKMGSNKAADVMAVQTCLANIKVKMKPLYKGKVDGRPSKDLTDAICTFQCQEKIKPSGKIMPGDQTASKLKMRTPSGVKATALPMSGAAKPGTISKAREMARKAAEEIKKASSLPADDAASLAKAIVAAGEDGIPLNLARTDITPDSKFQVTLEIPKTALPSSDTGLIKSLAEKVSAHIAKTSRWASGQSGTLTYKTMHAIEGLDKNAKPSSELKSILGINLTGLDEAGKSLVGSLEKLSRLGDSL